ncbi:hypothetical protein PIB30_074653 [Stylosanthes scabra]|uniref:Uncharacterized protein n=1 Tax=Stylosanthes scabra TaxID=79078 RepID=A0ABU6RQX0_9FABA|nr:hypothetical protein [Stylosanthes scabra]
MAKLGMGTSRMFVTQSGSSFGHESVPIWTPTALRCDDKGINVEAESCYCPDEARSREDAAYKLLDNLL